MAGYNAKKKTGATASGGKTFEHPPWAVKKAKALDIPNFDKLTFDELKTAITDRIREDKNAAEKKAETSEPASTKEASKEVAKDVAFAGAPIREAGGVYINVAAPVVPAPADYVKTYTPVAEVHTVYSVARDVAWWCQAAIVGAALWTLVGKPVGVMLAQASMTGGM